MLYQNLLAGKEAEDGAAGAGHCGIDGAAAVKVVYFGLDLGVAGADGGLEVVHHNAAPFARRPP